MYGWCVVVEADDGSFPAGHGVDDHVVVLDRGRQLQIAVGDLARGVAGGDEVPANGLAERFSPHE
jgi:hypothetical protein